MNCAGNIIMWGCKMKKKLLICKDCWEFVLLEQRLACDYAPYYCMCCDKWLTHDKVSYTEVLWLKDE